MTYGGVIAIPDDVRSRMMKGETIDPADYYFRVTPRFHTGSEKYNWLNNVICVAKGKIGDGWVEYTGFQIL